MRASSYNIYVELPDGPNEVLLVHGYTGAYDRVSRAVADYVISLEADPPSEPLFGTWVTEPAVLARGDERPVTQPSDRTIEVLVRRGYLTTMSRKEEPGFLARLVKKLHRRAVRRSPSYIIMPTYDCNLRCGYCFQNHMRTDPRFGHLLQKMTRDTADRMIAAFPAVEERHGLSAQDQVTRSIGFFGGEPLLAENKDIIRYIMERVSARGPAEFWAVTNATELDAYTELLGPGAIARVQITLDGPPDEHDQRRVYPDGTGSFLQIARNIGLCLELGVQVQVRMNIDRRNVDELPRLASEFIRRRWHEHNGFVAYTAPIHPTSTITSTERTKRYFSTWELDQAIDAQRKTHPEMRVIARPDDGMIARAQKIFDADGDSTKDFKTGFCAAHSTMYIFDAFGDIYACWEKTGDRSIRIGSVLEDGSLEMNEGLTRLWRTRTSASNPTCRNCRYNLHCGGGCAALAEGRSGTMHSNYCDGFAERFRHSVAMAYDAYSSGLTVQAQERVCDL